MLQLTTEERWLPSVGELPLAKTECRLPRCCFPYIKKHAIPRPRASSASTHTCHLFIRDTVSLPSLMAAGALGFLAPAAAAFSAFLFRAAPSSPGPAAACPAGSLWSSSGKGAASPSAPAGPTGACWSCECSMGVLSWGCAEYSRRLSAENTVSTLAHRMQEQWLPGLPCRLSCLHTAQLTRQEIRGSCMPAYDARITNTRAAAVNALP